MYKRIALFSSELFESVSNDPELRDDIEFQMKKVYDDEVEIDEDLESKSFSTNLIGNDYSLNSCEYNDDDDFIGKFKCILCPNRVLLNDLDLEKHLKSRNHLKMVKKWDNEQKKAEEIRKKFNQYHGICIYDEKESDGYTDGNIDAPLAGTDNIALKPKRRKKDNKLTDEQIKSRKMKFKRKKERRLMKKLGIK
ncbi:hypothetical protein RS030_213398 [Cryptosporidium xiaoi]|uniref:Zinc finger double-stranded RNA binding domain-containing protein n=1 Tax=Cryptosporidium xiaoi TaxID=659607 RepID=A0AAV9XWV0_9CRYT